MKYLILLCFLVSILGCKKLDGTDVYTPYDPAEKGFLIGSINGVYYRTTDLEILQNDASGVYVKARGVSVNRTIQVKIRCQNKVQSIPTNSTHTNVLIIEKIGGGSEIAYQINGYVKLIHNDANGLKIAFNGLSNDRRFAVSDTYFWK